VKEETGGGIGFIRVDALARGDEPDAMRSEFLNGRFAMEQRSPKPVKLPAQDHVEFALSRIVHQTIKLWPAGFGTAPTRIDVLSGILPAVAPDVFAKFSELHFTILI
jgi:hypothetical protein